MRNGMGRIALISLIGCVNAKSFTLLEDSPTLATELYVEILEEQIRDIELEVDRLAKWLALARQVTKALS